MSKKRVLVIGVGSIGERHLRCFGATGRAEMSLCEPNENLRKTIAERYNVQHVYADLDVALKEPYDAAVICAPGQLHIPMARKIAERGIHLLIEKPLSITMEGVEELRQLVHQRQLKVMVGYTWRSHPGMTEMRNRIAMGHFGKPLEIVVKAGQHFPTFRPAYRQVYYTKHETGGGAIQDAITHMMNAGEWLVGPIDELVADAAHMALEGVDVEDTVHILTRQNGALGSYSLNQHQAPNEGYITVVCERGTVRFETHNNLWKWMRDSQSPWEVHALNAFERDTMFIGQSNIFLDVLDGKREPPCTLEDGIQTLRVNIAALASVRERCWKRVRH